MNHDACRRALERLREEYKADSESLAHSEAISIMRWEKIKEEVDQLIISSLDDNPALERKRSDRDKYSEDNVSLRV